MGAPGGPDLALGRDMLAVAATAMRFRLIPVGGAWPMIVVVAAMPVR